MGSLSKAASLSIVFSPLNNCTSYSNRSVSGLVPVPPRCITSRQSTVILLRKNFLRAANSSNVGDVIVGLLKL